MRSFVVCNARHVSRRKLSYFLLSPSLRISASRLSTFEKGRKKFSSVSGFASMLLSGQETTAVYKSYLQKQNFTISRLKNYSYNV